MCGTQAHKQKEKERIRWGLDPQQSAYLSHSNKSMSTFQWLKRNNSNKDKLWPNVFILFKFAFLFHNWFLCLELPVWTEAALSATLTLLCYRETDWENTLPIKQKPQKGLSGDYLISRQHKSTLLPSPALSRSHTHFTGHGHLFPKKHWVFQIKDVWRDKSPFYIKKHYSRLYWKRHITVEDSVLSKFFQQLYCTTNKK